MENLTDTQKDYLAFVINAYGTGFDIQTSKTVTMYYLQDAIKCVKRAIKQTGNAHYRELLTALQK